MSSPPGQWIMADTTHDAATTWRHTVDRLLNWFRPVRPGSDRREVGADALLVNAGLVTSVFALLSVAMSFLIGFRVGAALMLGCIVLLLATLAYFRVSGRFRLSANLYLASGFFVAILGCSFYTGGLHSLVLPWFSIVPVMAALLLGFGIDTIAWTALACVIVLAFGLAGMSGFRFPVLYEAGYTELFNAASIVGLVLALFMVVSAFNRNREMAEVRAQPLAQEAAPEKEGGDALEMSVFLAAMSHEIRTPLNTILGLTYLLKKSELSQKQSERIDKIHRAGEALLALSNHILDLSKTETGKLELAKLGFPVGTIQHKEDASASRSATPQPGDDMRDGLLKRLKEIPGFNAELGFDNLDHSLETYIPLLRKYVDHYRGQMNIFREHLDASNVDEARQFIHSLKGAAAFLGAVQIHMMAAEIDMAFREQYPVEDIEPLWVDLETEQDALLSALLAVLPEETVVSRV